MISMPYDSAVFGKMHMIAFMVTEKLSSSIIIYGMDVTNQSAIAAVTADFELAKNAHIKKLNAIKLIQ